MKLRVDEDITIDIEIPDDITIHEFDALLTKVQRIVRGVANPIALKSSKKREPWSDEDISFFKEHYHEMSASDLAEKLGRDVSSIYTKASNLGLRKNARNEEEEKTD